MKLEAGHFFQIVTRKNGQSDKRCVCSLPVSQWSAGVPVGERALQRCKLPGCGTDVPHPLGPVRLGSHPQRRHGNVLRHL